MKTGRRGAVSEEGNQPRATGGGTTRRPSVRRNRDYSVKVTWTYELNKDLYDCYVEADRSIYGYSGRMKPCGMLVTPSTAR